MSDKVSFLSIAHSNESGWPLKLFIFIVGNFTKAAAELSPTVPEKESFVMKPSI